MNYFELFNLPQQFAIDQGQLSKAYQTLAQLTHPDKHAASGESQRLLAVQKNAQVNDGYQVLKTPLSRAEHLLELRGVELKHEQRTMQDPAFLMQQMEWREQLEELDSDDDPLDVLDDLDDEIRNQINAHTQSLQRLLDKKDAEADLQAGDEVRKLKFLVKLRHEIASRQDSLSEI